MDLVGKSDSLKKDLLILTNDSKEEKVITGDVSSTEIKEIKSNGTPPSCDSNKKSENIKWPQLPDVGLPTN